MEIANLHRALLWIFVPSARTEHVSAALCTTASTTLTDCAYQTVFVLTYAYKTFMKAQNTY